MLNKKGITTTWFTITNLIRITFIGLIIVVFFMVASKYVQDAGSVPKELKSLVYVQRFVYSPYCFATYDTLSDRVYPLYIDMGKFNNEQFSKCYNVDKGVAFRLTLNDKVIQTKNWNGLPQRTFSKQVYVNNKESKLFIEVNNE